MLNRLSPNQTSWNFTVQIHVNNHCSRISSMFSWVTVHTFSVHPLADDQCSEGSEECILFVCLSVCLGIEAVRPWSCSLILNQRGRTSSSVAPSLHSRHSPWPKEEGCKLLNHVQIKSTIMPTSCLSLSCQTRSDQILDQGNWKGFAGCKIL